MTRAVATYPRKCINSIPDEPNIGLAVPKSKERFVSRLLKARVSGESTEQAEFENEGSCTGSAWYDHHGGAFGEGGKDVQVSTVSPRIKPCRRLICVPVSDEWDPEGDLHVLWQWEDRLVS